MLPSSTLTKPGRTYQTATCVPTRGDGRGVRGNCLSSRALLGHVKLRARGGASRRGFVSVLIRATQFDACLVSHQYSRGSRFGKRLKIATKNPKVVIKNP